MLCPKSWEYHPPQADLLCRLQLNYPPTIVGGIQKLLRQSMRRPRVRFSRTVDEYSQLLSKYFEDRVDHTDEKIADVLHRFAANPASNRS